MADKKPSFEESMAELETLVTQLENGEMPLDKSLKAFEKGVKLVRACQTQLQDAELRVEKVIGSENGSLETTEFEVE